MPASDNILSILITAKDEASKVLSGVAASATAMEGEVTAAGAALEKAGKSMSSVGSTMTRDITVPIAGLAAVSGKMAYDFNNQMELLHTSAGIPQDAIKGLSDSVLSLAGETGQAPEQLAAGLYHVASAGAGIWGTSQQLDILKVAAEGANLGMANLDDTTYALTSAMASGVKGASDANQMMAVLTATVGAGDMKMQDLNGALSTGILSTAASFGISVQSIGSALATLTDNGEHADEAATRLRMTIALMSSPSSQAAKQLQALGLTAEDATQATAGMNAVFAKSGLTTTKLADDLRQPNGISVAIQDLKSHLEDAGLSASETDAMLSKAFGGGRTDAALLTLLQNTTRMDDKFKSINDGAGQMQQKLNDLNNTPNQQLRDAWDGMQASLIKIGDDLLPVAADLLKTMSNDVQGLSQWWESLDKQQQSTLEWLIGAVAIGGPIVVGLGKIVEAVGFLTKGLGSVIGIGGDVAKALSLAPVAEEAGVATEALVGGSGLLAALGPVGLAIGGIAVALGGTYMAAQYFTQANKDQSKVIDDQVSPSMKQYQKLASDLGMTVKSTGDHMDMLGVAHQRVAQDQDMVIAATKQVNSLQNTQAGIARTLADRQNAVSDAQKGVSDALHKFGDQSPQYQSAVDNLKQKQVDYALALNDSIGKSLDLQKKTGDLGQAEKDLQKDTSFQTDLQIALNDQLNGTLGVIGRIGPTALDQVGQIGTLQSAIHGLSIAWSGTVDTINLQSADIGRVIQGIGSDISNVQNQSLSLNAHLGAALSSAHTLQGAIGGSLQGGASTGVPGVKQANALGTNFAPGGLSLVGENGPELVNLPTGSKVFTSKDTQKMMGGGGANLTINGGITISNQMDQQKLLKKIGMRLAMS